MKNKNSEKKRNRPRRLGLAALAVTALLTLTFSACSEGGSTELENSGFESGSGASIDGWSQYNYKKDYEGNTDCTQITLAKMVSAGNASGLRARTRTTPGFIKRSRFSQSRIIV